MKHYLIFDLGTGSTRVALTDSLGNVLGMRSFTNIYYRDDAYADGQYFLPAQWLEMLLNCCMELHKEFPDIRADVLSAAGARQSIVLLDENGAAFYGLPNIDNRGRQFMSGITDRDYIYEHTGKWVTEDFCAAKLMGLKKVRREIYDRVSAVVSLSEWICYIFTGVLAMEPSQACETQLFDLSEKQWSQRLCSIYGIDIDILPQLTSAGTVYETVFSPLAQKCGLSREAVFVVGGADTQAALYQTGINKGEIAVVSGTTSPVVMLTEDKYYDSEQRVWTDANFSSNGYVIEMNPGVTGLNYQRIKEALCPDLSYESLEAAYAAKTEFSCTASFSSLLFYEQRQLRHGGFFMASPLGTELNRIDMCWAVLADIACSIYEQLFRLRELTGCTRNYVLCAGGGFRSAALCRMLSDVSGLELRLSPGYEQATVFGLVKLCNEALGVPLPQSSTEQIIYSPRPAQLIHRYHPIWSQNRLNANK